MEEPRLEEAEESASPDSGKLLEQLLAYMVGMPPEEVSRMVGEYSSKGGKSMDPSGLFHYLSARGRRYQVLWAGLAFSEAISVLFAAVLGPGKEVLFSGAAALPLRGDSGTLKLWNRALELSAGAPLPSVPEKVSEGDMMMAGRAARQLELKLWPQWIPRFAAGLESLHPSSPEVSEGVTLLEDGALTIELSMEVSREVRDEAGKGLNLSFLRGALVALPELRDLGLEIRGLSEALDRYVDSAVSKAEEEPSVEVPPNQVFERAPDVDPIQGVPISDLRPGDSVMLERRGKPSERGTIYMIRMLRNSRFEVHGSLEAERGIFFRFVAPGDIKVRVPAEEAQENLPPLFFWGAIGAGSILLVGILWFFLR